MRIFLTLNPSANLSVPGSMTWYRNLYEPLIDLGHDVYLLRIDTVAENLGLKLNSKQFNAEFSQNLLEIFKKENDKKEFELFFSYLTDLHVNPICIEQIRKSNVMAVNFSCNNEHQFHLTKHIAPYFDFNLHSEKNSASKFEAIGARHIWFPMAANPKYYKPYDLKREYDVTCLASNYGIRPYYIHHLLESNVDVRVWGPGWAKDELSSYYKPRNILLRRIRDCLKLFIADDFEMRYLFLSERKDEAFKDYMRHKYCHHFGTPLTDDDMIKLYSRSKISLGFLEVYDFGRPGHIKKSHIHLREFEAPMCGSLYLTNYSEELAEHYELEKEIVVFRNEEELTDKISYYLKHEDKAEKIRAAGYKRALRCHTYQKRLRDTLDQIFERKS